MTESDRLLTDLQALVRGRLKHICLGDCPDAGKPTERDQSCPACQVLLRLDAWQPSRQPTTTGA